MYEVTPLSEVIEKHIDRIGLPQMLELIAIICDEKAEHIAANYGADTLIGAWERTAKDLDAIAAKAKARGATSITTAASGPTMARVTPIAARFDAATFGAGDAMKGKALGLLLPMLPNKDKVLIPA